MLKDRIDYFLIVLALTSFSGIFVFTKDEFVGIFFVLLVGLSINYKIKGFSVLLKILFVFFVINVLSLFFGPISILTVIATMVRISIGFMLVKFIGVSLLKKLTNVVSILASLSLPLFIIQNLVPKFFHSLDYVARLLSTNQRFMSGKYSYGFHTVIWDVPERNCGFAWEPGAFSVLIGISLLYLFVISNFKFTRKIFILLITAITTLSTTMYFVLFIMLIYVYYKRGGGIKYILFPLTIVLSIIAFNSLYFLSDKIFGMFDDYDRIMSNGYNSASSASGRFVAFVSSFFNFLKFPLGQGVNTALLNKNYYGDIIGGPSGLGRYIVIWGVTGILFLRDSLKKSNYLLLGGGINIFGFIILAFFFANPIEWNPILLAILFMPYVVKGNIIK